MSRHLSVHRLIKTDIDAKVLGAVSLGLTENGTERFYPFKVMVRVRSGNTISLVASVGIGITGPGYVDLMAAFALTGLTDTNKYMVSNVLGAVSSISPGTEVFANVTVIATATEKKIDIILFGVYL